jgi:hypothetical protein
MISGCSLLAVQRLDVAVASAPMCSWFHPCMRISRGGAAK